MSARFGHTDLPEEQTRTLQRAIRLQWITIAFLAVTTVLIALVLGSSQAMKAAWIEDLLSFAPPIAFLFAVRIARKRPTVAHPYGYHRSIGVAHLVAGVALLTVGAYLLIDSGLKLVTAEHPTIGAVKLFGTTFWLGWLMIAALALTIVPPIIIGHIKMKLAASLHDKVLYADADMNKADWQTAVGAIIGIVGIGLGVWWLDSVAALFISQSILRDGIRNMRGAIAGLMDARATTFDGESPDPLTRQIDEFLSGLAWASEVGSRVRDEGHVFHVESFLVPVEGTMPTLEQLSDAREHCIDLDWKIQDLALVITEELPAEVIPYRNTYRQGDSAAV